MKPCPECKSNNVYRYKQQIDAAGGYGPDLLPKLAPNIFSHAKCLPLVCADCGYIRLYASPEALRKLENSKHWTLA